MSRLLSIERNELVGRVIVLDAGRDRAVRSSKEGVGAAVSADCAKAWAKPVVVAAAAAALVVVPSAYKALSGAMLKPRVRTLLPIAPLALGQAL